MLREDNADLRLTEAGRALGIVDDARWDAFARKRDAVAHERERLRTTWTNPRIIGDASATQVLGKPIEREYSLSELLRRPEVNYTTLMTLPGAGTPVEDPRVAEQVEIQAKYEGYIARQRSEVVRREGLEGLALPLGLDYHTVHGLSAEVRQMLLAHRPETVGQAARISGVTPAAISLLLVHLKRGVPRAKKTA